MPQDPLVNRHRLLTRIAHWARAVSLSFVMLTSLQIFNARPSLHIGKEVRFAYDNAIPNGEARTTILRRCDGGYEWCAWI